MMASPRNFVDPFAKQRESQKETYAWWACVVWIASAVYLYLTTPGVSLFSLSALAFIVVGMFAASIVLGGGAYVVGRVIARILTKVIGGFPGPKMTAVVVGIGWLLLIAEIVIGFEVTKAAFQSITES